METSKKIRVMVECAIMIALATVLNFIKVWQMPLGGSITLLSMLPICFFSVKNGIRWGSICSLLYAFIQIGLDLPKILTWGLTAPILFGSLLYDYILAYGILGLSGLFGNKSLKCAVGGVAAAVSLRFVFHFVSGCIFFGNFDTSAWEIIVYSATYNGTFMLPELIFTTIGAAALYPMLKRFIDRNA